MKPSCQSNIRKLSIAHHIVDIWNGLDEIIRLNDWFKKQNWQIFAWSRVCICFLLSFLPSIHINTVKFKQSWEKSNILRTQIYIRLFITKAETSAMRKQTAIKWNKTQSCCTTMYLTWHSIADTTLHCKLRWYRVLCKLFNYI